MEVPKPAPVEHQTAHSGQRRHPVLDVDRAALAECADVIEAVLSSPATRYAWLLGFLTGSALVESEAPIVPDQ